MRVVQAEFLVSVAESNWPAADLPEVAFVGRSNVGKSSLLAALTGRQGLVRVSRTPGRTQLINFFHLIVAEKERQHALRFVDLPGFGYAKVAKAERQKWFARIERYLGHRSCLKSCVLLCDARRGAELDETELAEFLRSRSIALIPVLAKADQIAKHQRKPRAEALTRALGAKAVVVSAKEQDGVPDLWQRIFQSIRP